MTNRKAGNSKDRASALAEFPGHDFLPSFPSFFSKNNKMAEVNTTPVVSDPLVYTPVEDIQAGKFDAVERGRQAVESTFF